MGPLSIIEVMGPVTFKIEMPPKMEKAHNVFQVSNTKLYTLSTSDSGPFPVLTDADRNIEQEAVAIPEKKVNDKHVLYLVQLEGDSKEKAIWIPRSELENCMNLGRKHELSTRSSKSERR